MAVTQQAGAMERNFRLVTSIGTALLAFSLLFNAYVVWRNRQLHKDTQYKAIRLQQIEVQSRLWQQFIQDMRTYSATRPAVDPILQKYGLKEGMPTTKPH